MTKNQHPLFSIDGAKATITLNRPEHHNRIDPDDIPKINQYLDNASADPAIRALVFTGTGMKTFSSGYTLDAILTRLDDSFQNLLGRIEQFNKPTICVLNGSAYGGGVDLATACDFRIGVLGSRMFVPAAKFGLHYHPDGIRRFVQRIGSTHAKKIFMLGKTIGDEEMLRIGFLSELVPYENLSLITEEYLKVILDGEPSVITSMKENIHELSTRNYMDKKWIDRYQETLGSEEIIKRLNQLR